MVFTPLEIIALILIALSLIKIIIIFINKKIWYKNVVEPFYKNRHIASCILSILSIIIFYFIIQELTFSQIFVAIGFSSILLVLGFLQFSEEFMLLIKKIYSEKLNLLKIIYILIWVALIIAVIKEIIF